ncbi:MAG: metallophosphoesterase [Hyphomicrobiaceae bacterium]
MGSILTGDSMTQSIIRQPRKRTTSGKLLFRYAVISDTHLRLPEDARLTPWKSQAKGVERAELAMRQIEKAEPEFLVHLGDMVQPVPHLPSYTRTAEFACQLFEKLDCPVHYTPGNHDIGDKLTPVTPAHETDAHSVQAYEAAFGASYYAFEHGGCIFLVLNSSLVGSGLPQETEQFAWLEAELERQKGRRTFVKIHYPLFIGEENEASCYDNVEQPGRERLLSLINSAGVEAVFAGHVHNFFYHATEQTEFYSMLSTCFVRHDYQELFSVAPDQEFGRNDEPKLGWAEVEIYEHGHDVVFHRMMLPGIDEDLIRASVRGNRPAPLGVQMRSAWAELKSISINGPVDEFQRRRVRNDYEILALWETGLRDLRCPLFDLEDDAYFERIQILHAHGHRFTFYTTSLSVLEPASIERLAAVDGDLDVIVPWKAIDDLFESIRDLRNAVPGRMSLACTVSASDHRAGTFRGGYVPMSFGFDPSECNILRTFHDDVGRDLNVGYTFRFGPEVNVLAGALEIRKFLEETGAYATVNLVQAGVDPAAMPDTPLDVVKRLCEAMIAGRSIGQLTFYADTLVDHDRGYFPRQGLYDGRVNPGLQARAIQLLAAILLTSDAEPGDIRPVDQGWRFELGKERAELSCCGGQIEIAVGSRKYCLAHA